MARPKEFNRDTALLAAMMLFWRQGFAATSIAELCAAMGINRQSLYDSFGDKHALFLAAIDHYCTMMADQLLAPLMAPGAGFTALQSAAVAVIDFLFAYPDRPACLMVNTTMEVANRDPTVDARVKAYMAAMEDAFAHVIANAQAAGELAAATGPRDLARYLVSTVNGLIVAAKAGADRAQLQATLALAIRVLEPRRAA